MDHDEPDINHRRSESADREAQEKELDRMRSLIHHIERRAKDLLTAADNSEASYTNGVIEKAEELQKAAEALQDEADRLMN